MNKFPRRGEVWLVNWNPARGSEQAGIRPALIIQNDIGNEKSPTTIVAAISSAVKLYPMNVKSVIFNLKSECSWRKCNRICQN